MAVVPLYYILRQMPGLTLRMALNDVPFYRRTVTFNSAANGPIRHFLVPGENTLQMELFASEVNPKAPNARVVLDFVIAREEDDVVVHTTRYPELLERHEPEDRKLPLLHRGTFEPPGEQLPPIWEKSPREVFPPEGTADQRAAVIELHEAYAQGDVGKFLEATRIKLEDYHRYYPDNGAVAPAMLAQKVASQLRQPWDVAPLDPNDLVFERWADGRVAYVTRRDGGHALCAKHREDPQQEWLANLYLTRVDGRWRIFR